MRRQKTNLAKWLSSEEEDERGPADAEHACGDEEKRRPGLAQIEEDDVERNGEPDEGERERDEECEDEEPVCARGAREGERQRARTSTRARETRRGTDGRLRKLAGDPVMPPIVMVQPNAVSSAT